MPLNSHTKNDRFTMSFLVELNIYTKTESAEQI